jgi:hypothetical protein
MLKVIHHMAMGYVDGLFEELVDIYRLALINTGEV